MIIHTSFFKILSGLVFTGILASITGASVFAISPGNSAVLFGSGPISSMNNDWILAGNWMGIVNTKNLSNSGFHSTFEMVMKNGSSPHVHEIYNATLSDIKKEGNNTVIKGSVSITMKDGPVKGVPTIVTLSNNNTIAISLDSSKIGNHFGVTPIFGIIHNPEVGKNIKLQDPNFLEKWIPVMMGDVLSKLKPMGENMSNIHATNQSMMNGNMSHNLSMLNR